jgi:dephospho-CoA kinase
MDASRAMNTRVPVIGLMGGIGSGKSVVATILRDHGCIVANADENAKAVLRDSEVRDKLVAWWGAEILNVDGLVDTKKVSDIVFQDESARKQLEDLVHPRVRLMQEAQFDAAPEGTRGLVVDAPLLLEAGFDVLCDFLIFVESSRKIRLSRVVHSRGWTPEELSRREDAQLPLDTKRNRADYVLINEGALDMVHDQVKQILEDIDNRRHT